MSHIKTLFFARASEEWQNIQKIFNISKMFNFSQKVQDIEIFFLIFQYFCCLCL